MSDETKGREADHELNASVAREVMEWEQSDDKFYPSWHDKTGMYRGHIFDWQPATDAVQTMLVVGEMIDRHDAVTFRIDTLIPNSDAVVFYADFTGDSEQGYQASDFSLLRAICLAALEHVKRQKARAK